MSDSSSRILLLSESNKPALSFVGSVISKDISLTESTASQAIPWTISNKYYTADIHFQTLALPPNAEDFEVPADALNVQAVLFVWNHGKTYRNHAAQISHCLRESGCEPEVCLAIRLASVEGAEKTQADEEDAIIDDYLSTLGFEFISDRIDTDNPGDIPGIPRAIDALSTIMWPSMKPNARPTQARTTQSGNISINQARHDLSFYFDEDARRQDLDELAQWLDEPETTTISRDDPWSNAALSSTIVTSLNDTVPSDKLQFDDDFTAFVSAPSVVAKTLDDSASDLGGDTPDHQSLSLSEFGELGSDDEDLPSDRDIRNTSARIFGSSSDGNFDLNTVLSALDGMKVEIASISNKDARKRAAASAALGLIYGLDMQKDGNEEK